MAIALSRGFEHDRPDLAPLIDAVSEYQLNHPSEDHIRADEIEDPGTPAFYVLAIASLAENSELATDDVVRSMTNAAEKHGMGGIYSWLLDNPHDGSPRAQLSTTVFDRALAIQESGMKELPSGDCNAD